MPHYLDGTPAKVGDKVRGRGYNLKGEIEAFVLDIRPGSESCNLTLGVTKMLKTDLAECPSCHTTTREAGASYPMMVIEYGQANAFEKVAHSEGVPE